MDVGSLWTPYSPPSASDPWVPQDGASLYRDFGGEIWGTQISEQSEWRMESVRPATVPPCTMDTVLSSLAFTASTTLLYHFNKSDQYQDHFLFGGITLGLVAGLAIGRNLAEIMLKIFPWTILASLVCSILFHRAVAWNKERGPWSCCHCKNEQDPRE